MKALFLSLGVPMLAVACLEAPAVGADLTLTTGGKVTIEIIFSEAAFSNTLSVVSPSLGIAVQGCQVEAVTGLPGVRLASEKQSQRGCRVQLDANPATPAIDPFPAGTTFQFRLCAQTNADPACEFVWASDPTLNSDSFDHLRTTPIHAAEFPGRIFQLAWEDLPGGGDMDFNDFIAVLRVDIDTDGDGLWDDWEQFGIDTNGDGIIDLDLPGLGANRLHKDIFLEIDFMDCAVAGGDCAGGDTHSHRPKTAAVNAVIQAFANANVTNPDGNPGIALHVDVSNAIAHQNNLNINGLCFAGGTGIGSFDAVKADPANFGPANPRRFAFHYALFTHQQVSTSTSSGCGEFGGNDFQVSLGGWNVGSGDLDGDGLADANVGTVQQQAGTLMHEFGHNLTLQHGGGDGTNFKPNYLSVMNYRFQTQGIPPTDPDGTGPLTGRVDYSPIALAALNENSLTESAGIGDGTDSTRYLCPSGVIRTGLGTGGIDWNCDGDSVDVGISVDLNGDSVFGVLQGFNDWANLRYVFQDNSGQFADGVHAFSEQVHVDIDFSTALQIQVLTLNIDIKPGTVPNSINPRSKGTIPVAILSTPTFDAFTEVDVGSPTFGRIGTEPSLAFCNSRPEDVNGDGLLDLVCHFETSKTNFQLGDTQGVLNGQTRAGNSFTGSDSVRIVPFK